MQFNFGILAFVGITALTSFASAQQIAFGQELQNDDQTNHWVVWIEHEKACPGQQVLGVLTKSPCDQPFNLGEIEYMFSGCSGQDDSPPTLILDSGGNQIGGCGDDSDKITCHGDDHDIIKHGVCTLVTGA